MQPRFLWSELGKPLSAGVIWTCPEMACASNLVSCLGGNEELTHFTDKQTSPYLVTRALIQICPYLTEIVN